MKSLTQSPYRKWVYIGLLVQVIAAWFSVGYYHPDEHYQVLEFCNYKLGHSPLSDLPWEYSAHCRPALQPFIAFCLSRLLEMMGLFNPFMVAFMLRLFMGIFTWWATLRLVTILLPDFTTERGRKFFVGCSFFLWFIPFIGVRFSSETIAADCFLVALSLLLKSNKDEQRRGLAGLAIAGFLLGLALFLRLQIGFAYLGLACWLLFIAKTPWKNLLVLCFAGIGAIIVGVFVDHWFYGEWLLTPYNYFNVNIIQHVAAKFGTDPWWYYFVMFFNLGIPPLSVVLLPLFFTGLSKKPKHLLSLVAVTFFVGHFLIGHKEMRFLFPASFPFIFIACTGLEQLLLKVGEKPWLKFSLRFLVVFNVAILLFKMVTPAEEVIKYYGFIYNYSQKHDAAIVSFHQSPYKLDVIECNFYKPRNLQISVLETKEQLTELLKQQKNKEIIYLSRTLAPGPELAGFKVEKLYCEFPDWLLKYNVNHWQDRSYIWAVYKVSAL